MLRICRRVGAPGVKPPSNVRRQKPTETPDIKVPPTSTGLQIQNGEVKYAINFYGGRIASISWNGFELLPQDQSPSREIPQIGITEPSWKETISPHGDKTLRAPQNLIEKGFPILDWYWGKWATETTNLSNGDLAVCMTSPTCRDTVLEAQRTICLSKKHPHTLTVTHLISNKGTTSQEAAIWNIETTKPGKIIMPWGTDGIQAFTGFGESEQNMSKLVKHFGQYGVIDHTLPGGGMTKYGSISSQQMGPMIVGIFKEGNKIYAYLKRFQQVHTPQSDYGANGFSQETYSHGAYSELELATASKILQPGDVTSVKEWRTLMQIPTIPKNETDIQLLINMLLTLEKKASISSY
jgi:hypothetical protein